MLLEVPHWDPSVRAGLALLLGMIIGGARQAKKDKSEARNPRRKPETTHISWVPGFQISLQALFSSYP
jgi:hypothetical protein